MLVHVYCPALIYASSSHKIIKKHDETFYNDDFIDSISGVGWLSWVSAHTFLISIWSLP